MSQPYGPSWPVTGIAFFLEYIKLKSFYLFVIHERVVRFEILTVVVMMVVCWNVMECSLVGSYELLDR
jgi:hypothetical protein